MNQTLSFFSGSQDHDHVYNAKMEKKVPGFMDHVYISFADFLWVSWILRPSAMMTTLVGGPQQRGLLGMVVMKIKEGFNLVVKKTKEEAEATLFNLVMETSLVTWVKVTTSDDNGASLKGEFEVPGTFHALPDDNGWESGTFYILLDVSERRVKKASFNGEPLDFSDAITIGFLALSGMTHPVIHTFANWGVNTDIENAFLRKMALCTIKYNSYGVNQFRTTTHAFRWLGVQKHLRPQHLKLVNHHGSYTIPKHNPEHWKLLKNHSEFVRFIFEVRALFMKEFRLHKNDFTGIDAEALFLGTVFHSVDHLQMGHHLDITDFVGTPSFEADRELATAILSCYVDHPFFRLIECKFKRADHPLFRSVYTSAATLNKRMANGMECCIAI